MDCLVILCDELGINYALVCIRPEMAVKFGFTK